VRIVKLTAIFKQCSFILGLAFSIPSFRKAKQLSPLLIIVVCNTDLEMRVISYFPKRKYALETSGSAMIDIENWQKGMLKESDIELTIPVGLSVWRT
jgi:hypothetical protein